MEDHYHLIKGLVIDRFKKVPFQECCIYDRFRWTDSYCHYCWKARCNSFVKVAQKTPRTFSWSSRSSLVWFRRGESEDLDLCGDGFSWVGSTSCRTRRFQCDFFWSNISKSVIKRKMLPLIESLRVINQAFSTTEPRKTAIAKKLWKILKATDVQLLDTVVFSHQDYFYFVKTWIGELKHTCLKNKGEVHAWIFADIANMVEIGRNKWLVIDAVLVSSSEARLCAALEFFLSYFWAI